MHELVALEGRVVRLEPLTPAHVGPLLAAATHRRDSYAYTAVPADEAGMRAYVDTALQAAAQRREVPFAIRRLASGDVVGSTRFLDLCYWTRPPSSGTPDVVEIGSTWLAGSAQRSPVNTECKLLLLTHAFDTWRVLRVTLKTDVRNVRSRMAIARLGAVFEGVRRAHMPAVDGGLRDTAYYSIVAAEWPAVRERLGGLLAAPAGGRPGPDAVPPALGGFGLRPGADQFNA